MLSQSTRAYTPSRPVMYFSESPMACSIASQPSFRRGLEGCPRVRPAASFLAALDHMLGQDLERVVVEFVDRLTTIAPDHPTAVGVRARDHATEVARGEPGVLHAVGIEDFGRPFGPAHGTLSCWSLRPWAMALPDGARKGLTGGCCITIRSGGEGFGDETDPVDNSAAGEVGHGDVLGAAVVPDDDIAFSHRCR